MIKFNLPLCPFPQILRIPFRLTAFIICRVVETDRKTAQRFRRLHLRSGSRNNRRIQAARQEYAERNICKQRGTDRFRYHLPHPLSGSSETDFRVRFRIERPVRLKRRCICRNQQRFSRLEPRHIPVNGRPPGGVHERQIIRKSIVIQSPVDSGNAFQSIQIACKRKQLFGIQQEKRFFSRTIPRQKQGFFPRIINSKSEHAGQMLRKHRPVLFVKMNCTFRIGIGSEPVSFAFQ